MWIRETERTARYRFWFDVREPGAAAYAGQLGAEAVYLAFIVCGGSVIQWCGWAWLPGFILGMMSLYGAIRRLELWAALVLGAGILGSLAALLYLGLRANAFFLYAAVFLLLLVYGTGLPLAIRAAWVHRGLRREERWDLLGLATVPEGTPRWRRRFAVWIGLARPENG